MNKQELLAAYAKGVREFEVSFTNEDFSELVFRGCNFSYSFFTNCNFNDAGFTRCDMESIKFRDCNLNRLRILNSDCSFGRFINCDLTGANFRDTKLNNGCLQDSELQYASFDHYLMYNCDLRTTKNLSESTAAKLLVPPEKGRFIAYKKLASESIAMLEIPASAKRSSATTRKCRSSKARVLKIWDDNGKLIDQGYSRHDYDFIYRTGELVEVKDFDEDRWSECSTGIHFFLTKQEAIDYF